MDPERGREAMEVVGVVGEQVGPFEAPPFPDRLVDVNGASARRRGRTAVVTPVDGAGPRVLANAGADAARRALMPAQGPAGPIRIRDYAALAAQGAGRINAG